MGKKYKGTRSSAPKYDYASDVTYNSDDDDYTSSGMYHQQQQQLPDYYYPQQGHNKNDYYNMSSSNKHKGQHHVKEPAYKMNKYQTIVLKVQVHCDACIKKVKKAAADIDGVESINVDTRLKRVSITGYIDPKKVLKKVAKTGKQIELIGGSSNMIGSGGGGSSSNMMYNTYSNAYNSNFMNAGNTKSLLLPFDGNTMDHHVVSHHASSNKHSNNVNMVHNNMLASSNMNTNMNTSSGKNKQHALNTHHPNNNSSNMNMNMMNYNTRSMLVLQNPTSRNEVDHIFSDDNVNNCSIM